MIEKRENSLENKLPRVFLSNFYFGPMYANRQASQPVHTALRAGTVLLNFVNFGTVRLCF